eukprot:2387479-Prymnesium_polylepis.1
MRDCCEGFVHTISRAGLSALFLTRRVAIAAHKSGPELCAPYAMQPGCARAPRTPDAATSARIPVARRTHAARSG